MMAPIKNVIVIGASGSIGASIFKALVDSSKFNVSVLARPESTAEYGPSIKVFRSDYSEASLAEAFKGQDAVVSALGAAAMGEQIKIIHAAVKAGVKRYLPSEYGTNTQNEKATGLVPAFGFKVTLIEHLKKLESKGLSWTAIETGPAFDWGLQMGLVGFNINTHEALIMDGGNRPFSATNLSQIGNAVVAVLSKPDETANQFIYVDSFTATQNEILAELEKATGKKWTVTESTTEAAAKEGQELFSKGDFSGLLLLLKTIMLGEGYGSDFTKDASLANEKLGLPKQGLAETVAALAAGKPVSI
ncbi:Isoflavone reductase-like protein [Lachnellula occidentalis]|uniref:Isoflavone reductase-like protein n=1 Tax=Lachnellula occidentalis TaxID=215460 RepID=A0A8H8S5L5_9HELO|nr:Isoflavone reductase-like protein [Lachnellula occidentalis]